MRELLPDIIAGLVTIVGVILANRKSQAITDYQIQELTREVRKHNGFAEKIPVINNEISHIKTDIAELKEYHK